MGAIPRPPRAFLPGVPQHLIQRGNNRTAIFLADEDYRFYLDSLHAVSLRYDVAIHAYVLMTNHVHLLATPAYRDSLARLMQALGRRYVRFFNAKYQRTGTLWEGRFRACLIDSDRYVLGCYRYIELNSVRAKMVGRPSDYRWSSYRVHADGDSSRLITKHPPYLALGATDDERQAALCVVCPVAAQRPGRKINSDSDLRIYSRIYSQLELLSRLPRAKQRFVSEILDTVLQQASR